MPPTASEDNPDIFETSEATGARRVIFLAHSTLTILLTRKGRRERGPTA